MTNSNPVCWWHEPGIRFGFANAAVIVSLLACAALGARGAQTLVILLVVVAVSSLRLPAWLGAVCGAPAWAFYTGFVVNQLGELTFRDPDLVRLALLIGVGAVAASVGVRRPTTRPVNSGGISWQTWSSSR